MAHAEGVVKRTVPLQRGQPPKKVSAKKLKALGGKVPFSTITGPRKPLPKARKPIKAKGKRRFPKGADRKFLAWIRTQPCVVGPLAMFGKTPPSVVEPTDWTTIEAAHVRSKGAGGNDLGNVVPLCRAHHREQHTIGIRSWQTKYALDLKTLAADYAARYLADHPSVPHVSSEGTP